MKWLFLLLRITGVLLLAVLLFVAVSVKRPDTTPYQEAVFYRDWKKELSKIAVPSAPADDDTTLLAGWAKVNITPRSPGPMAGYGKRKGKPYTSVHDSVFIRTLVLEKNGVRTAIVAADLLLVPPTVTARLKTLLTPSDIPYEQIYLGATHSHNSVGGWGKGLSALFFSGPYDPSVEETLAQSLLRSIRNASSGLRPARVRYEEALDSTDVNNRLIGDKGTVDPEVRMLVVQTADGQTARLVTYAAHSTVLASENMILSRDWPGVLVDSLEAAPGTFALYMAGAVGSMSPTQVGNNDFEELAHQASGVLRAVRAPVLKQPDPAGPLRAFTLPLPMGDPTPRITPDWVLRPWLFNKVFGVYPIEIKALRIGNVLMIGLPCDFSGELMAPIDAYAKQKGLNLVVTSFNGGYTGYITDDRWYNLDAYETVIMNWYGPHKGAYLQEVIRDLVDKLR